MLSTYMIHAAVRGFHVYGTFWSPHVGDLLATARETINLYDRHAIAVLSGPVIVGHLPKEISKVCHHFIKRGGVIQVEIIDSTYRRSPIREGGLEIPAVLIFFGHHKDIDKLSDLLTLTY